MSTATMSATVSVNITRATHLRGESLQPGMTIKLPPLDAHALVANGKAELRDDGDVDALQAAVQAADFRIARSAPGYMPSINTKGW
jgi:hypothetical protein